MTTVLPGVKQRWSLGRWLGGKMMRRLLRSPTTVIAVAILGGALLLALGAEAIAPYDTRNPATANIIDARLPPNSTGFMGDFYLLGTDPQGRDILSTLIYGLRLSLTVGFGAVILAALVGIVLGLLAGYRGGLTDAIIMRIADVQLSFPAILIALLFDGIARGVMGRSTHDLLAIPVLIASISASYWVQYARTVRGVVLVERSKEYVLAARITGVSAWRILLLHIAPNAVGAILVIGTINLALAIIAEATLSFLGVGVPPTLPSLGAMVRVGNEFVFSGEWWILVFPSTLLVLISVSVNLLGDWLRDGINPKLVDP